MQKRLFAGKGGLVVPRPIRLNWYVYCGNDPVNFVDILGLKPLDVKDPNPAKTKADESKPGNYSLVVYVNQPGDGGDRDTWEFSKKGEGSNSSLKRGNIDTGHTYVEVIDNDTGEGAIVGFYGPSATPISPKSDGDVKIEDSFFDVKERKLWDVKREFEIDEEGFNKAKEKILKDLKTPPDYDLNNYNCTDWVIEVAKEAGVDLPDTTGKWSLGEGSNAGDLGEDLVKIGGERNKNR